MTEIEELAVREEHEILGELSEAVMTARLEDWISSNA